ncbi:MAG: hypothetical protein MUP85_25770, partial [Candidatus Lokiarchaeota archaeon]|nr:hypothetical protein [Candidatus Lokiarchaeota archaeon]
MDSNKTSLARIKIKFPDQLWISHIFKKFSGIRMEIESFLPYDFENSIGNSIIEIFYYSIDLLIDEVKNHDSVIDFSIMEKEENRVK